MKTVNAAYFEGQSFSWNLNLFSGPKFTIRCGECKHTFCQRLPLIDVPSVLCPACHTLNRVNVVFSGEK